MVVDAPLLRAAQLKQYWRAGQAAGFEVYVARPLSLDAEVRSPFDPARSCGADSLLQLLGRLQPLLLQA